MRVGGGPGRAIARLLFAFTLLLGLLGSLALAHAAQPIPALEGRVVDLAKKLTQDERKDLELRLEAYEKGAGYQIAILIVPSLDGEPIEDLSYRVAQAWKLGRAGKDDGVLITAAIAERRVRIEVGKGLEGDLTDLESSLIIREQMRPFTKQEKWHDAFAAAIAAIEKKVTGKVWGPAPPKVPKEQTGPRARRDDPAGIFLTIILFAVVAFIVLRAIRGGRGGGGGGGPFIWWGGGGGGWGGGGGGDGGGFSGGGGSFGGGGASDDV